MCIHSEQDALDYLAFYKKKYDEETATKRVVAEVQASWSFDKKAAQTIVDKITAPKIDTTTGVKAVKTAIAAIPEHRVKDHARGEKVTA